MPHGILDEVIFGFCIGFGGAGGWALFNGILSLLGHGRSTPR
jgi:hypothetical protein